MAQCSYRSPEGASCGRESVSAEGNRCFWHDPEADKTARDVKSQLEMCAQKSASLAGVCLESADLEDVRLMGVDLRHANLTRANLKDGHLFGIDLRDANLFKADLSNANLREARLEGANLLGVNFNNTDLERVLWGEKNRVIHQHQADLLIAQGDVDAGRERYLEAEEIYRNIRKCYEGAGLTDVAGEFFYNEMVAKRKQMSRFSFGRFWSKLVDMLCGYGEIPYRVIGSSMAYIFLNACVYGLLGLYHNGQVYTFDRSHEMIDNLAFLGYAVYFSIVTFTTLGYGDFSPVGWAKPFAAIEGFVGAFMIALFILAFVKKMTR